MLSALALLGIVLILAYPRLPSVEVLTDYHPKIPLRIYTADGFLIGEFGEERRHFAHMRDVPEAMKQAILAAEDERFYQHPGIDTLGVLRAAYANFIGGGKRQGASTITMQVARNFFLSSEKTLTRKLYEALLAFKIESNLSKDEIFQIYINQIYLGQRAYGFAAAARIYFGKELKQLDIAEMAVLAGLPKAPSAYNPVANPKRARLRQQYVLRRMHQLGFIDAAQYEQALAKPLRVHRQIDNFVLKADHAAEMARQIAVEAFPEEAYVAGLKVVTTITRKEQEAAYQSLRTGVLDYDRRHGYRGAEAYVDIKDIKDDDDRIEELLQDFEDADDLRLALVLDAGSEKLRAYLPGGEIVTVTGAGLKFARRMLDDKAPPNKRLRRGAIIRLNQDAKGNWQITQWPEVEAAFVAANPSDGAIRALVGGFDFNRNKFNHVTQAWRQPGSSMKPFIYSAALEKGFTPLSVLPDEPLSVTAEETGSQAWEPKNYDGKYDGPMTLRTALAKSKNLVSIRLIQAIDPQYAQDYVARFGFDAEKNPPYLTLALGAGSVTPWQSLAAYTVFANGGYQVTPHIVKKILDANDKVLAETTPALAGDESLRIIDARNAWVMDSMMKDVVRRGTATRAAHALKRADLAGKTGTTNDYVDAWFCGYQPSVVGVAWIGFDQPRRLGDGETGGTAALPIWIGYMQTALKDVPEMHRDSPSGMLRVESVDPATGDPISDVIYREAAPDPEANSQIEAQSPFASPAPPAPVQDALLRLIAPDRRVPMPTNPTTPAGDPRPPAR
ncbi:MAG: penicillin-binding protein 1A [Pseudomonadota bacterium]